MLPLNTMRPHTGKLSIEFQKEANEFGKVASLEICHAMFGFCQEATFVTILSERQLSDLQLAVRMTTDLLHRGGILE